MPFPDSFTASRLKAERLTVEHLADIRDGQRCRVHGAARRHARRAQTTAYMACNLRHWADYGFGLWILCDAHDDRVAGRAVIRHLDVDGTEG